MILWGQVRAGIGTKDLQDTMFVDIDHGGRAPVQSCGSRGTSAVTCPLCRADAGIHMRMAEIYAIR
jgi:hypothetical protein